MDMRLALRVAVYNLLLVLIFPAALLWYLFQLAFVPRRRVGLAHRFGNAPRGEGKVIWIHAVSVGEVRAVIPMMARLREGLGATGRLFLSTVTVTGQETARRECPPEDEIFYFPLDLPWIAGRALDRVRPSVFVTVETELWPNFLKACHRRGIPVVVVNGRISDRSFRYYQALRWFFAPFIGRIAASLMQSSTDAERIKSLGARPESVQVTGNAKFDRSPHFVDLPAAVLQWSAGRPVLVAGSTHRGEDEILADLVRSEGFRKREVRLVLAPRHPERFDDVASMLSDGNVRFGRYSQAAAGAAIQGDVLLVDAMGVLESFYRLATMAFVGGSLVPAGGHNLLEPALLGRPVLTGPHTFNFKEIAGALVGGGGARVVSDGRSLAVAVGELLADAGLRAEMGRKARAIAEKAAGASRKNASAVLELAGAGR